MVKVFILGLDGLEYNFVEKWDLVHLKQREYGKIKVPIDSKRGVPVSPEVWASFLTGKHVHKELTRSIKPLTIVFKLINFLHKRLPLSFGITKKFANILHPEFTDTRNFLL